MGFHVKFFDQPQGRLSKLAQDSNITRPRQLEGQSYRVKPLPNPLGNRAERRAAKKKKK